MLRRRLLDRLDVPTIAAALALAVVGMTAIASATIEQPGRAGLWKTQLAWLGVASVAAVVVIAIDYHIWAEFALSLHGVTVALLVAVLLFGKQVGGNKSWLVLGPLTFQPSEFAKWTTCVAVASFLAKRVHERLRFVPGASASGDHRRADALDREAARHGDGADVRADHPGRRPPGGFGGASSSSRCASSPSWHLSVGSTSSRTRRSAS